jgi:hypothetical protein
VNKSIKLYIHSSHAIGGVTTWSLQVSDHVSRSGDIGVVAVGPRSSQPSDNVFPGTVVCIGIGLVGSTHERQLLSRSNGEMKANRDQPSSSNKIHGSVDNRSSIDKPFDRPGMTVKQEYSHTVAMNGAPVDSVPTLPTLPTIPTKPTLPTKPTVPTVPTKATLPTKPTKATLPTKPTLPDLSRLPRAWDDLDDAARTQVEQTQLFVPNYVEVGYRHAALSRVRNMKSRCLGYCHTDEIHYYALLKRYDPIIQTFVAVSRRCAERLKAMLPHRSADILIVPYGIPIPERPRLVPQYGSLRLLYSGRIVKRQKRILDFADLVRLLEERHINYSLDFVGEGTDERELKEAMRMYPRIKFLGSVPYSEMSRIYPQYDVLVLTSESEGLSIAMLEAMSFGVVPVVTRVSGAEDTIIDNENGFLCEIGDLSSMAERLEFLALNRKQLASVSRSAFDSVREEYTVENHMRNLNQVIDDVMSKPLATNDAAVSCL